MWATGSGALGSFAFLAVNSLAIQTDATFDISDIGLIAVRIVLGALIGTIITLPFGFPVYLSFVKEIALPSLPDGGQTAAIGADSEIHQAIIVLAPFLLGFSTPLVMAVLNRLVTGVEAIFGVQVRPRPRPGGPRSA